MSAKVGPSDRISEDDLLKRVLQSYGIEAKSQSESATFLHHHIEVLETSQNDVAARTGFVLKRAFEGYGLGYKIPLAVIAIGQAMLGLDLAVAAPFVASNPVALTCAAVGAIYYGYNVLSDDEKASLNAKVAAAFDFGAELVRSVVDFSINLLRSILNSENLAKLKVYVSEGAQAFGLTIADITGSFRDRLSGVATSSVQTASWLASSASSIAGSTATSIAETGRSFLKDKGAP